MRGYLIRGIDVDSDPEVLRMQAELSRLGFDPQRRALQLKLSETATDASGRQLYDALERRKRNLTRANMVNAARGARERFSDMPADEIRSRAEAAALAVKLRATGMPEAQVREAAARYVDKPSEVIGFGFGKAKGKARRKAKREERKAEGKGVFRKIGNAIKKGAGFVFKGLAKLNPVLVGARAATLSLVKRNAGGIATQFAKGGKDKARKKWENLGGNWSKLRAAIEKGTGQPITGLHIRGEDDDAEASAEGEATKKDGLDKLWQLAKPIIEKLLSAFGVSFSKGADGKTKVAVAEGGVLDQQLKSALAKALQHGDSEATKAVEAQANDALDPNSGAGAGHNSGNASIGTGALIGIAALLAVLVAKN